MDSINESADLLYRFIDRFSTDHEMAGAIDSHVAFLAKHARLSVTERMARLEKIESVAETFLDFDPKVDAVDQQRLDWLRDAVFGGKR